MPVKRRVLGKSRLATLGDDVRTDLVAAFAFDTVAAVVGTPGIALTLVVTDDFRLAEQVSALGAAVIPDGGSGLNETLVQAAAEVARRDPELEPLVVCADLPGLTPEILMGILDAAPDAAPAFVPDAAGTGTTIYLAPDAESFTPSFGADSALAHRDTGAVELKVSIDSPARHDVDTPDDLERLRRLGLGAHTRLALARHQL